MNIATKLINDTHKVRPRTGDQPRYIKKNKTKVKERKTLVFVRNISRCVMLTSSFWSLLYSTCGNCTFLNEGGMFLVF